MSDPVQQHQVFSDGTIRRFLLAQLSREERSAFETALLTNLQLERRVRLAEIALTDDYAADRLRTNDCAAFQQKFLVTAARQKKLEVSAALQRNLANGFVSQQTGSSPNQVFSWPRLAWRIAFAIVVLMVLCASALVIRREPRIVKSIIPKRLRPAAFAKPTPQAAHHATSSSESPVHRDELPSLPAHEASPQTIVLRANTSPDNAPVVVLTSNASNAVRFELMLEKNESATFSAVVTTSSGEIVHNMPEIRVDASDRIDFDVQIERLKPGDFQVTVTRLTSEPGVAGTYYFRAQ